ncbi:protein of unknown function [Methanocaldococcus lauensis]|uniref:Uncharacterized protein n=1 Tax=Methanocaldococcus lauensis TaxID=2546128 RepID=A0A8D6SX98_9EURY|nr:hypothetical protein [Methanocaldococcus lauensis]CAB3289754.1 protein of unknown function [Methanocaldococcus lauensis]
MDERDIIKAIIKEYQQREMHLIPRDIKLPKTNKVISIIGIRRSGKHHYFLIYLKKQKNPYSSH